MDNHVVGQLIRLVYFGLEIRIFYAKIQFHWFILEPEVDSHEVSQLIWFGGRLVYLLETRGFLDAKKLFHLFTFEPEGDNHVVVQLMQLWQNILKNGVEQQVLSIFLSEK